MFLSSFDIVFDSIWNLEIVLPKLPFKKQSILLELFLTDIPDIWRKNFAYLVHL